MGSPRERHSYGRADRRAERELQQQLVALGLDSPSNSPTRQILRPVRSRSSNLEDPLYLKFLDYLVRSVLDQFGLIIYHPPDNLSFGDYFRPQDFVKMFKITYIQSELWFTRWKSFFRYYYLDMVNRDAYLQHLFIGLGCIYSRKRPFFENLLAAHSFVFCATVYFCYNGWDEAFFHPFRVLASHFEGQLRIPFARAGGFKGLARFCANHDLLKMYEFYCEHNITREHQALEKDVKVRVRNQVSYIQDKLDFLLRKKAESVGLEAEVQGSLAYIGHGDLGDVRRKRLVGNEWKFKDIHLFSTIFSSLGKKPPKESPQDVLEMIPKDDCSTELRPPILSQLLMSKMRMFLEDFNAKILELEKRVEGLLE